jgi:predicted enzyme related to lactoylglutathione lyase
MSRWIRSGTHKLGHWDALLPSTTPASQAGILHGNNDGIPNFRWWEKKEKRLLVANHPEDATEIERRVSNGEGLLSPGGASISNIFTGDGDRAFLVMSTIKVKERGLGQSDAFAWFFVSPYNYLVMGAKFFAEVVKEMIQSARQQRAGIVPHMGHHRRMPYPFVRAATNVALRALGTSLIIQEMTRGTPVVYMDYTDYDEIAHHSGPERPESLDALDGVDRELGVLLRASQDAARPYRFVILADHGQSLGMTFLQRYGYTLQDHVRKLMGGDTSVGAATESIEDWGQLNTFLGEVSATKGASGSLARRVTKGGSRELGPEEMATTNAAGKPAAAGPATSDLIVVAGGNLAHIYFNVSDERMTMEQIDAEYPEVIKGLVGHQGVGFILVRTETRGPIVIGKKGIRVLNEDLVEGEDPIAHYGELAARALLRQDEIAHCGDIVAVSIYDPETGEIAAFEELIGAHGGLGGAQTRPFLLYPSDWELDEGALVGAPAVYRQLRRWMEGHLGMTFGQTESGKQRLAAKAAAAAAATPTEPAPTVEA